MTHGGGDPAGIVLAAPHEGYDMYSGDMAKRVSNKLGWAWVVADEYRDTSDKRWLDVNRPTQRHWRGNRKGDERVTDEGRQTYAEYLRRLRAAGQVEGATPLRLLVEFHGHNRRVQVGREKVRLDVIELATQGFADEELRSLYARYQELAAARWPVGPRIELRIDRLHPEYPAGERVPQGAPLRAPPERPLDPHPAAGLRRAVRPAPGSPGGDPLRSAWLSARRGPEHPRSRLDANTRLQSEESLRLGA
jgi:hypothetical protein